jgi:hypothetical protein
MTYGHDGGQAGQDGDGSSQTVALASGSRGPALPAATVVLGPANQLTPDRACTPRKRTTSP